MLECLSFREFMERFCIQLDALQIWTLGLCLSSNGGRTRSFGGWWRRLVRVFDGLVECVRWGSKHSGQQSTGRGHSVLRVEREELRLREIGRCNAEIQVALQGRLRLGRGQVLHVGA